MDLLRYFLIPLGRSSGHAIMALIPAFDATNADIRIYKTAHHRHLGMDYRLTAVEIAMATAAAPTYFPSYDSERRITLVDGGIWANDPVGLAVVEAVTVLGWDGNQVDVLSLGCTDEPLDFKKKGHSGLFWARRAMNAAMRGQSRSALGIDRHLTGRDRGLDNVVRISPTAAPGRFALDDSRGVVDLQGLAYAEARHALPKVKDRFFCEPAEGFTPANA